MIAVVLAAGRGNRLRPLTDERPKAMLEVAGRPILLWGMDALAALEPERFVVVVGAGRKLVEESVGDRFAGIPVEFAKQTDPTGSAAALRVAEPYLGADAIAAVMNGDNVFAADLGAPVRSHLAANPDATLLVERVPPELATQGVCRIEAGRVVAIVEHPAAADRGASVISAGFYVFQAPVFEACRRVAASETGELELSEAINLMIREGGTVTAVPLEGSRVNVNRPEDLERAERLLSRGTGQPQRP